MIDRAREKFDSPRERASLYCKEKALAAKARAMCKEDIQTSRAIGDEGPAILPSGVGVLAHPGAGACHRAPRRRQGAGVTRRHHNWLDV